LATSAETTKIAAFDKITAFHPAAAIAASLLLTFGADGLVSAQERPQPPPAPSDSTRTGKTATRETATGETATREIAGSEAATGARASGETADYLRSARNAFIDALDFQGALGPARELVSGTQAAGDAAVLPNDLATLARVEAELSDFDGAERDYLKAIDLIQHAEGEFSISLMDAYQGLGRSYIKNRRFPEAIAVLDQARHISQRNLGLFNVTQTPLIDDLTTAYLGLGDTSTAQRLQQERLENAVRRFGEDDPKTIPFRYQLASYYDESRLRSAARTEYEKVLALVEQQTGVNDSALLRPLRELLRIDLLLGDRDDARTRIADILARDGGLDPREHALALAALGDWSTAKEDSMTAKGYYAEAYRLLDQAEPASSASVFAVPEMLDFVAPLTDVDRGARTRPYAWGAIELAFDVSAEGRASNVSIVKAAPAGLVEDAFTRRIRETHFRPRIVAGAPVMTPGVRSTHYFRYYVAEKD
jgi:tetratricopeptide (TPR) repeat protein